jgi:hypothetical protein
MAGRRECGRALEYNGPTGVTMRFRHASADEPAIGNDELTPTTIAFLEPTCYSVIEVNTMTERTTTRRHWLAALFAALFIFAGTGPAHAQGFISPLIGYNFGGDAGCPEITNCQDKRIDYGVSIGALGSIVGFEAEFGYTKNFFGETSTQTSNVLTFMSNFMLAPKIGPVQPYGLAGLGLIRTSIEDAGTSNDQNQFGWDVGGGLMVFFGAHVGVRGDVRYFHSFQIIDFANLPNVPIPGLNGRKLDYGRIAAAMVFKF